jgi:hypothetical protein
VIRPRAERGRADAAEPRRRDGWITRRRLVGLLGASALLAAVSTVPAAYGLFADSAAVTTTVSTAVLAPPTNPAVTQSCTPPSTIVLRGATSATGTDALTIDVPLGTTTGDVLVAQVANRNGLFGGITPPAGWSLLDRRSGGTAVTSAVYWKIATATEPATVVFDLLSSSGIQMVGGVAAYDGVSTSAPINAWAASTGTGGTTTLPSVTTTAPGTTLVRTITKRQEAMPAPVGTTERWQLISGNGTATEGATGSDEVFAGSGASPARSTSTGFSTEWVAHTVALRPTPGTPTANASWTPSTSTWATGYVAERWVGSSLQLSGPVTPVTASSAADGPLVNGTTYTYRLWTYRGSWSSGPVSITFRPDCP